MKLVQREHEAELYDMENGYFVTKEPCSWIRRGFRFMFNADRNSYLPDIYDNINSLSYKEEQLYFSFSIQTVSYGALPPEEIRKVISGYQTAIDTIKTVEEFFK